ncbi:DUF2637 domain-containing protein [Streptomyces noursei]|nr:DUF2637 domain-containing protein [Streptomyces noursei]
MATHNPTQPLPAAGRLTWAPLAAAALATVAFAFLAFRLSFVALTALATEHGVEPDVVWMFAVLVDGGAVVGTVGVIAARRAGRSTAPYWWTVVAFASVSLAFNVAHADGTLLGVAIAVVPPVAQLVATELLVRMLPTAGAAAIDDITPAVAAATDAARRAQAAADAAHTDATAVQATLDTAARTVTDAAARAEQAAATLTDAAAPPLALVDLAAAVAAIDGPPAVDDALDDAPPPLPPRRHVHRAAAPHASPVRRRRHPRRPGVDHRRRADGRRRRIPAPAQGDRQAADGRGARAGTRPQTHPRQRTTNRRRAGARHPPCDRYQVVI